MTYAGTSTSAAWTTIVADTVTIEGDALVQSNFDLCDVAPPTRKVTLVE